MVDPPLHLDTGPQGVRQVEDTVELLLVKHGRSQDVPVSQALAGGGRQAHWGGTSWSEHHTVGKVVDTINSRSSTWNEDAEVRHVLLGGSRRSRGEQGGHLEERQSEEEKLAIPPVH